MAEPFRFRDEIDIPPRELGAPSWQQTLMSDGEFTKDEADKLVAAIRGDQEQRGFRRFDLDRLDGTLPPEREWILPGFIPEREVTLFTGPGGAGKSLFAQQLATAVALGKPFLGLPTPGGEEAGALYVTAEDDESELHRRQHNILATLGASRDDLRGEIDRLALVSLRGRIGNELVAFERDGEMQLTEAFNLLRETIFDTSPQLVVLDNVAHLFPGNENDRGQVTRFVNALYKLARSYGVTVLLVAHPNKSGAEYSGSTAWLNAVRSQIDLSRVDPDCDPDARALTLGKANYARAGQTLAFRWHNFAFVRDDDLPADYAKELAQTIKANGENAAFLACLRARAEQGEGRLVGPSPGPNYAPSPFEGMAQAKGHKKPALKRAMDRLFSIGQIESYTYHNTAKGRDVTVIREVPEGTPNASPNPSRTPFPNDPEQSARTSPHTHLYTTYIPGAASRAAAPDQDDDLDWGDEAAE